MPIVLGTIVLSSRVPESQTIFDAVFFVVLVSVLAQGATLEPIAARLGLLVTSPAPRPAPLEVDAFGSLELVDFHVREDDAIAGAAVRELGLPRDALVAVVARGDDTIPPRGTTLIEPDDHLFVLVPRKRRAAPRGRLRALAAAGLAAGRGVDLGRAEVSSQTTHRPRRIHVPPPAARRRTCRARRRRPGSRGDGRGRDAPLVQRERRPLLRHLQGRHVAPTGTAAAPLVVAETSVLPGGSYLISAKVVAAGQDHAFARAVCQLRYPDWTGSIATTDNSSATVGGRNAAAEDQTLSLLWGAAFASAGRVSLVCWPENRTGPAPVLTDGSLSVLPVSSINP